MNNLFFDIPLDRIVNCISDEAEIHNLLKHFDVNFYKNHEHVSGVKDLEHLSNQEATVHFITTGKNEKRSYNKWFYSFIDPIFYMQKYPELELRGPGEAIQHWMYYGVYEKRIPNIVSQQFADADIHLFQMGKVGSKSIEHSLKAAGHKQLIPHIHWADELAFSYPSSFYSYPEIINFDHSKHLIFISGVRDPVERVISGYIQSIGDYKSSEPLPAELDYGFLMHKFEKDIIRIVNWFKHGYFKNINIYNKPFDANLGYTIINQDNITIFLYRQDALDRCWPALSEITGLNLKPYKLNKTLQKPLPHFYYELLYNIEIKKELNKIAKNTLYCKHFNFIC